MLDKRIILLCCFNIISLIGCIYFWNIGIETYSGGVCEYWRCVNQSIVMLPIILVIVTLVNSVSLIILSIDIKRS